MTKFLSRPEVLQRTGVSYVTIWKMMRTETFPRARQIGRQSLWVESEIDEWIRSRPIRRLKGDADPAATPSPSKRRRSGKARHGATEATP